MGLENCFRSYEFKTQLKKRGDFYYLPICLFLWKVIPQVILQILVSQSCTLAEKYNIISYCFVVSYGLHWITNQNIFLDIFILFCSQCLITNSSEFSSKPPCSLFNNQTISHQFHFWFMQWAAVNISVCCVFMAKKSIWFLVIGRLQKCGDMLFFLGGVIFFFANQSYMYTRLLELDSQIEQTFKPLCEKVIKNTAWHADIIPINQAILAAIGHRFIAKKKCLIQNANVHVWGDTCRDHKLEIFLGLFSVRYFCLLCVTLIRWLVGVLSKRSILLFSCLFGWVCLSVFVCSLVGGLCWIGGCLDCGWLVAWLVG